MKLLNTSLSIISTLVIILLSTVGHSQELRLNVTVSAPRIQNADPQVFKTLESELSKFFNDTKWTEDEYEDHEKIEGNISINITEDLSTTAFTADILVQCIRPIFNSNYKTQTLNFQDKSVAFTYTELQPLQNSFNNYIDPLSSLMTFYAYMILGYDYDSFSAFGGEEHFRTAKSIINNLPSGVVAGSGWDNSVRSNISRVNIIDELLSPRMRPYRQAMYDYHIKSLDRMSEDANKSRAVMTSSITAVGEVNRSILNSGVLQMFSDSKRSEIIEIFKGAPRGEKSKIHSLMVAIDPSRASEYSPING